MYTVIFKSGHALEQYRKIKFRVRQSVRWLKHIPCLLYIISSIFLAFGYLLNTHLTLHIGTSLHLLHFIHNQNTLYIFDVFVAFIVEDTFFNLSFPKARIGVTVHSPWFLITQSQKIGILLVVSFNEDVCNQSDKPTFIHNFNLLLLPYPINAIQKRPYMSLEIKPTNSTTILYIVLHSTIPNQERGKLPPQNLETIPMTVEIFTLV